ATAGVRDGLISVWGVADGRERVVLPGHTGAVLDLAFSRDGRQLASVGGSTFVGDNPYKRGEAKLWGAPCWEEPTEVRGARRWARARDGGGLLLTDGKEVGGLRGAVGVASPKGIDLFDMATGARRLRIGLLGEGERRAPLPLAGGAFSPDGKQLAVMTDAES